MRLEELPVIRLEESEFLKACKGVAKFKAMPDWYVSSGLWHELALSPTACRGIAGVLFWRLGQWLFWKPQVAPHIFIENIEIDLILPLTTHMDYKKLTPDQWLDPFSATLVAANAGAANFNRNRQMKRPYRPFTALQVGSLFGACQRCINLEICCWRHCWIWILGLKHEAMATQSQDPDDDDDALARVPKEMTSEWFGSRNFAVFLESARQILGLKGAVKMKEYTHEVTTNKRSIRRSSERSNEESTKWSIEGITERIK